MQLDTLFFGVINRRNFIHKRNRSRRDDVFPRVFIIGDVAPYQHSHAVLELFQKLFAVLFAFKHLTAVRIGSVADVKSDNTASAVSRFTAFKREDIAPDDTAAVLGTDGLDRHGRLRNFTAVDRLCRFEIERNAFHGLVLLRLTAFGLLPVKDRGRRVFLRLFNHLLHLLVFDGNVHSVKNNADFPGEKLPDLIRHKGITAAAS